jgi:hypothetical protein
MKYRDNRGSLSRSMDTVQEFKDRAELVAYLAEDLAHYGVTVSDADVKVEPYLYDGRIDWDTYIVTVRGFGVAGFTDGPAI